MHTALHTNPSVTTERPRAVWNIGVPKGELKAKALLSKLLYDKGGRSFSAASSHQMTHTTVFLFFCPELKARIALVGIDT